MTIEDLVKLIIAITSGGLLVKILDWVRDARQGHLQKRRAEVDAAIAERDKARTERDVAIARVGWLERWVRILEEHASLVRRRYIDAPCTDPDDLDAYPSRPDRDKP